VEAAKEDVQLVINLSASKPTVLGHWLNIGRALVNLASNAIDAMAECSRPGRLTISLCDAGEGIVTLHIADNANGIPQHLLERGPDGKPVFVGRSTKAAGKGEGFGTAQVWSTFGPERLEIRSVQGEGTEWIIKFERSAIGLTRRFASLQRRFHELQGLYEETEITPETPRTEVITLIWRIRSREIFLFELLERFSRQHNIRDLYRKILSFLQGGMEDAELEKEVAGWKGEHPSLNAWLSVTARRIKHRHDELASVVDLSMYRGALFKSWGQSLDKVIIFTLNPLSGKFLATDRKLAEHLDFVPYLEGERTDMLRGEFVGDVNIDTNPIYLGVWSVDSEEDLKKKLLLLQEGARRILEFGIHPSKRLAFYQSTYVRYQRDIDSDASSTFGEFAQLPYEELKRRFVRESDDELQGFLSALE
jgi:hypothetical protein